MQLTTDILEFDEIFTIVSTGNTLTLHESEEGAYVPDVIWEDDAVHVEGDWSIVHGLSNQDGIDNGILHPSESMSDAVVQRLYDTYGANRDFALSEVVNMDDMDELIGWVVIVKNS